MIVILNINGKPVEIDADPPTPLLRMLRDNLGLTDTRFGCGVASCGIRTIHLNGQPTHSCVLPISVVAGQQIAMSEHIADGRVGKAVFDIWVKHGVAQCGYCQSGQMMGAVGLPCIKKGPTDADVDSAMADNLCRCATYQHIRATIHDATRPLA